MAIDLKAIVGDKKKLIIVTVAIGAGLIAMVLSNSYIEKNSEEKARVLAGGISSQETKRLLERIESVEKANQDIASKQRFLEQAAQAQAAGQAAPKPLKQSLAVKTPADKRAITVVVEKLYAIGGMVSPGDYVDIITHLNIPSLDPRAIKNEMMTVTLFQNVLVLAVGNNTQPGIGEISLDQTGPIPITFALYPQEAGLISFAQQHGTLQLVLRSPLDTRSYLVPPATWNSLSDYVLETQGIDPGLTKKQQVEQPKSAPNIEIFRGGSR